MKIRIGVRVAVGEIVRVVLVGKPASPRERVQGPSVAVLVLGPNVISVVLDIGTAPSPAHALLARIGLTINERHHAEIVQALRLEEVAYGEAILDIGLRVLHLEVEPLRVLVGVQVVA